MQFLWYDYETTGLSFSKDRLVQFAAIRTDQDLNPVVAGMSWYCKPAKDYLPTVGSCMVHGVSPQQAEYRGLPEYEFATKIYDVLSKPYTCAVGYNAMKFDHRFSQFLFYRNLLPPYKWFFANKNTRWDIVDLMRAVYVLSPEGIEWPRNEVGNLSFRVQDLAKANRIRVTSPHEALSDVETTIALAKMVKEHQPRLYNYYLDLRFKRNVEKVLRYSMFIYVSGSVVHRRRTGTVATFMKGDSKRRTWIYDLSLDPRLYDGTTDQQIIKAIEMHGSPLHYIRTNASPFVCSLDFPERNCSNNRSLLARLNLDLNQLRRNRRLLQDRIDHFLFRVSPLLPVGYDQQFERSEDVDWALYDRFISDEDENLLSEVREKVVDSKGYRHQNKRKFFDDRFSELVFRFRARNFPDSLTRKEKRRWHSHCRKRLFNTMNDKGNSQLEQFLIDIEHEREEYPYFEGSLLLDDLEKYGESLKEQFSRRFFW